MPRVLIVDDESGVLGVMKVVLELAGFEVQAFEDPKTALEAFAFEPSTYDIVVSDLMMPAMKGTELASRILELRPGIPIVFVTGYVTSMDVPHADLLSRFPVLQKPHDMSLLKETVLGLVGNNKRRGKPHKA